MNNHIKILAIHLNADKFKFTPTEIIWKFLNKVIIIEINRQSDTLHVAAACDQMSQLYNKIRQAQKEQKLNYTTKIQYHLMNLVTEVEQLNTTPMEVNLCQ